jgi:hypothetical protein
MKDWYANHLVALRRHYKKKHNNLIWAYANNFISSVKFTIDAPTLENITSILFGIHIDPTNILFLLITFRNTAEENSPQRAWKMALFDSWEQAIDVYKAVCILLKKNNYKGSTKLHDYRGDRYEKPHLIISSDNDWSPNGLPIAFMENGKVRFIEKTKFHS